jgi:hypothetical protein
LEEGIVMAEMVGNIDGGSGVFLPEAVWPAAILICCAIGAALLILLDAMGALR